MLKFEQGGPGVLFTFQQDQPIIEVTEWEGKKKNLYRWKGSPDMLSASETLMNKLKEWNNGTLEGLNNKSVFLQLITTKKGFPFWVVESPTELPSQTTEAPQTAPAPQPAPTPQPTPNNVQAQGNTVHQDLKSRWITMLALLKFSEVAAPVMGKVTQAFQMERLIRKGFELQDKNGEVTSQNIEDLSNSPENAEIEKAVEELFGK